MCLDKKYTNILFYLLRLQLLENLLVVNPQEAANPRPLLRNSVLSNVDQLSEDIQQVLIFASILAKLAVSC